MPIQKKLMADKLMRGVKAKFFDAIKPAKAVGQ
jgi:hypothetical protein